MLVLVIACIGQEEAIYEKYWKMVNGLKFKNLLPGEDGFLSDDPPAPDCLQRAAEGEDPPVALPQLHRRLTQVLQPDAVPPPVHVVLEILNILETLIVDLN